MRLRPNILLGSVGWDKSTVRLIKTAGQAWITGLALGVVGFALFQIVPVYADSYKLEIAARKEARLASSNWKSDAVVQELIYEKARDLGLPVERQEISVASSIREKPTNGIVALLGTPGENAVIANVNIDVSYSVPVLFPGHTFYMKFHFHADERSA